MINGLVTALHEDPDPRQTWRRARVHACVVACGTLACVLARTDWRRCGPQDRGAGERVGDCCIACQVTMCSLSPPLARPRPVCAC